MIWDFRWTGGRSIGAGCPAAVGDDRRGRFGAVGGYVGGVGKAVLGVGGKGRSSAWVGTIGSIDKGSELRHTIEYLLASN
jgi:hypothetical protein